jgi:UDP-2-acetamido-3-amino-2,3-dideoxy-glucuronate N-acetyltransferase
MASKYNVHPSTIVEKDVQFGNDVNVWHFCHLRQGAILEDGVSLGRDCYVDKNVRIGSYARIQNGVSVYYGVHISEYCFVGPHVIFTNDIRPRAGNKFWDVSETHLRKGSSVGAGAIIRCGVSVGEFSMVGAGAIVTKDIPPFALAIGQPTMVSQKVCACGQTFLPLDTPFSELILECCRERMTPPFLSMAQHTVASLS